MQLEEPFSILPLEALCNDVRGGQRRHLQPRPSPNPNPNPNP